MAKSENKLIENPERENAFNDSYDSPQTGFFLRRVVIAGVDDYAGYESY